MGAPFRNFFCNLLDFVVNENFHFFTQCNTSFNTLLDIPRTRVPTLHTLEVFYHCSIARNRLLFAHWLRNNTFAIRGFLVGVGVPLMVKLKLGKLE